MVTIGELARYAAVSVRMLRHYDALGLLVPEHVDPVTGYRHYGAGQLPRLNRLLALKDLGIPLERIRAVLDAEVGADELRGMLLLRRAELEDRMQADERRLDAIERRLRLIEREGHMSEDEFVEKPLPAAHLAQLTTVVDDMDEIQAWMGPAYERLGRALAERGTHPVGPAISWYAAEGERMRVAAAFPTTLPTSPAPGAAAGSGAGAQAGAGPDVEVADLAPVPRAVSTVYRGGMQGIGEAWQALARHCEERGLRLSGPSREVYLESPMDRPDAWVTELQQPVE